jgi:hypothetical protein
LKKGFHNGKKARFFDFSKHLVTTTHTKQLLKKPFSRIYYLRYILTFSKPLEHNLWYKEFFFRARNTLWVIIIVEIFSSVKQKSNYSIWMLLNKKVKFILFIYVATSRKFILKSFSWICLLRCQNFISCRVFQHFIFFFWGYWVA